MNKWSIGPDGSLLRNTIPAEAALTPAQQEALAVRIVFLLNEDEVRIAAAEEDADA